MWVATAASSSLQYVSSHRVLLSNVRLGVFQQQSKGNSLFDAVADIEWLRGAAIELHFSVHVNEEGLGHALQFMLATDHKERASLLTMSNDLVSSMKAKEKGICCHFFWVSSNGEDHVYVLPFSSEAKRCVSF